MTTETNECREAFEQKFAEYYKQHGFISSKDEAFAFYQAAWNRRPAATADDQQAKDAARYRGIYDGLTGIAVCKWSEQDNRWLPCVNRAAADYTIDAALSTTKQEEV